ncbi:Cytochrome oxidase biogenesis protein Surf1, facilitates heme A insertion [Aequoribacter fuscus]|jgi:cytochrome oxidase assembly protein ShyY1|uniref:SURF1-like protein n=1 Tax=Aequoribacter fuscus TaxID=2518989 RepID=F3L4C0_9GAMM|nr:SURF1 family protein [Aequoribacter fuscus]EGG28818.1 Cytochrome oxidase biogenesis protein Surf1, facilitates heme A insertion [Aequoribacter fuscus]QHJ86806.1 SURF1 family protein [Aequoribacter fuscus]
MPRLRFDFEWRLTLFVVVALPIFLALGFWQLGRADEKRTLAANAAVKDAAPALAPEELTGLDTDDLSGRKIRVSGSYLPRVFLLDNQIKSGRFGNDVVQLFRAENNQVYFVNRGWVPADPARQRPTQIPQRPTVTAIEGRIYVPPGKPYLLEPDTLDASSPLVTIQSVDIESLSTLVIGGSEVFPHLVRLLSDDPTAFDASWPVVNISDAKHLGYAIQWFSMAFVLALLFIHRSSNVWALLRGNNED